MVLFLFVGRQKELWHHMGAAQLVCAWSRPPTASVKNILLLGGLCPFVAAEGDNTCQIRATV
jgi:hypothetical protein